MSARDKVLRLFESATMKALAVISEMKTMRDTSSCELLEGVMTRQPSLSQALQNRMGASDGLI